MPLSLAVARAAGRRPVRTALLAAALLLPNAAHAAGATVSIDNFTFAPATLTVAPGTTVTWTNADDIPHTVTASDRSFRSKPMDTNDRFAFMFLKPGTYVYFCSLHPQMTGKINVEGP